MADAPNKESNRTPEELEKDRVSLVDEALMLGADVSDIASLSGAEMEVIPTEQPVGTLTKVVDGDTFHVNDKRTRIKGIDTPESVHKDDERNTPEGQFAAQFAKDIMPSGTEVIKHDYGRDHYKRDLSSVERIVNGVNIDFGLVMLDQQLSTYKTQFGEHPDPMKHGQYKEYYSRYAPYQYGEMLEPLSAEDYTDMIKKHNLFSKTYSDFKEGLADQSALDDAMVDLYQDPNKVVRFRHQANQWNKPVTVHEHDASTRFAFSWANQSEEGKRAYNNAVKNAHLQDSPAPEQEPSFWRKFNATFEQLTALSNITEKDMLWDARQFGNKDLEIPETMLLADLPKEWHSLVLNEYAKYGGTAAMERKRLIKEDLDNNKIIEDMPLYAQFGYGLGSFLVDPLTYGVGIGAGGVGASIQGAAKSWTANRLVQNTATLGAYATGSAIESSLINAPRLDGDVTYTSKDYQLDVMLETILGTGIGGAIEFGAKPFLANRKALKESRVQELRELETKAANNGEQAPPVLETQVEVDAIEAPAKVNQVIKELADRQAQVLTPEENLEILIERAETSVKRNSKNLTDTKEIAAQEKRRKLGEKQVEHLKSLREGIKEGKPLPEVKDLEADSIIALGKPTKPEGVDQQPKEFAPWQAITEISPEGFKKFREATLVKFKPKSNVANLMKRQLRLNDGVSDELRPIANKLNADIAHIAAAYPDGKVPKNIDAKIRELSYTQKEVNTRFALENIIEGRVSNVVKELEQYVKRLNKLEMWERIPYQPASRQQFETELSAWLGRHVDEATGEELTYTSSLPSDLQMINEINELNKLASNKDEHFRSLVEQINGMVLTRLDNMSEVYKDTTQSFGKTVPMSPPEIAAQLKKEGLVPNTSEYSARMRELRKHGRKEVSEGVQEVGRVDLRQVGTKVDEAPADEILYGREAQDEGIFIPTPQFKGVKVGSEEHTKRVKEFLSGIEADHGIPWIGDKEKFTHSELLKDQLDQNLLPKSFTESQSFDVYSTPTKENLERLHKRLNSEIIDKLGLRKLEGTKEFGRQQQRMENIYNTLKRVPTERVISAITKRGDLTELVDFIRVSKTIANEQRKQESTLEPRKETPSTPVSDRDVAEDYAEEDLVSFRQRMNKDLEQQGIDVKNLSSDQRVAYAKRLQEERARLVEKHLQRVESGKDLPSIPPRTTPLSEEELVDISVGNLEKYSNREVAQAEALIKSTNNKLDQESLAKIAEHQTRFVQSGEKRKFQLAIKPNHALDAVGKKAAILTEDLATKFHNGDLDSLVYVGAKLTELGSGYGGAIKREATGGLIRDHVFHESLMQIVPDYFRIMDDYAASKGANAVGRMNAQQMAGAHSKITDAFNKDFMTLLEYKRQGKEIPTSIHESVRKFADSWEKYMDYNHSKLVESNITGFTKDRKIKNYYPQIWRDGKLKGAINQHGMDKVIRVLSGGYTSAINNGTNTSLNPTSTREAAEDLIDWISKSAEDEVDQFQPVIDSRAQQRQNIDTTFELEGLSVMDLLDTDVIGVGTKYSARTAGWAGFSKATNGMLSSPRDLRLFKEVIMQEGKDKSVDTKKYEQYWDDLENLMMGRPTRGGLEQEFREFKDLTDLTRMGGLGTAQLIESGQVLSRSIITAFSDPKAVAQIFKTAKSDINDTNLLNDIVSISSINDDLEHMYRQSVHLDQHELNNINKVRQLSLWVASKATFGKYKAPASRLLGKTTGYNMVRRFQSRLVQSSFTIDVAKHFKHGKGKMGNARLADLGLTDIDGNDDALSAVFNNIVEYDKKGNLVRLHPEKWPKEALEQFQYAMRRDEAQQIQRTLVGELPPWMNKPMMSMLFQFREMPIVAQNKSLGRSLAFADKEAATAVALNAMFSGLVRYSKFAVLAGGAAAITGDNYDTKDIDQVGVERYITQFGIFPELYSFGRTSVDAYTENDPEKVLREAPVYGLMKDYWDFTIGDDKRSRIDAAQGLTPLGNTAYGDMLFLSMEELINKGR